jgi:hypothetical protein
VQVKQICNIPIILLGDMWPDFIDWIEKWPLKNKLLNQGDMHPIFLADTVDEAMGVIRKAFDEFKKGGEDFCQTYKKYKID